MSVTSPVFGRWSDRSRRPTKDRHASISMYPGVHSTRDDRRSQSSTSSSSSPKAKKSDYNYRALAELVGRQPGLAVFRRFSSLNAKNLLYLQAEIADLEQQLGDCEKKDLESDDTDQSQFLWSVAELKKSNGEQWQKILELRIKLKEYSKSLALLCFAFAQKPSSNMRCRRFTSPAESALRSTRSGSPRSVAAQRMALPARLRRIFSRSP